MNRGVVALAVILLAAGCAKQAASPPQDSSAHQNVAVASPPATPSPLPASEPTLPPPGGDPTYTPVTPAPYDPKKVVTTVEGKIDKSGSAEHITPVLPPQWGVTYWWECPALNPQGEPVFRLYFNNSNGGVSETASKGSNTIRAPLADTSEEHRVRIIADEGCRYGLKFTK